MPALIDGLPCGLFVGSFIVTGVVLVRYIWLLSVTAGFYGRGTFGHISLRSARKRRELRRSQRQVKRHTKCTHRGQTYLGTRAGLQTDRLSLD